MTFYEHKEVNMFEELLFSTTLQLWQQKTKAEATNDIKLRTRLLRQYPELFISQTTKEIQNIIELLQALNKTQLKNVITLKFDDDKK